MVKSYKQCEEIQKRRVAAGLRGYAKAVRRFLKSRYPTDYLINRNRMEAYFGPRAK